MKIVLLNGPPRCGKDTLADMLFAIGGGAHVSFADEVKRAAHRAYGLPVYPGLYEDRKDDACPEFDGLTPRRAYQWVSEGAKASHGQDYWGRKLAEKLLAYALDGARVAYVTDSGFEPESRVLLDEFGARSLLHVHVVRPSLGLEDWLPGGPRAGEPFPGDTRSYWTTPGLDPIRVLNDGDLDHLRCRARLLSRVVDRWDRNGGPG